MGIIGKVGHGIEKLESTEVKPRINLEASQVKVGSTRPNVADVENGLIDLNLEADSTTEPSGLPKETQAPTIEQSLERLGEINSSINNDMAQLNSAATKLNDLSTALQTAAGELTLANSEVQTAFEYVLAFQEGSTIPSSEENPSAPKTFEEANKQYEAALQKQKAAMKNFEEQQRLAEEAQTEFNSYNDTLNEHISEYEKAQGIYNLQCMRQGGEQEGLEDKTTEIKGQIDKFYNEDIAAIQTTLNDTLGFYSLVEDAAKITGAQAASAQEIAKDIGVTSSTDSSGNVTYSAPESYDEEQVILAQMLNETIGNGLIPSNKEEMAKHGNFELNPDKVNIGESVRSFEYVDKTTGEKFFITQEPDAEGNWHSTSRVYFDSEGKQTLEYLQPENTKNGARRLFDEGRFNENGDWVPEVRMAVGQELVVRNYLNEDRKEYGNYDENGNWVQDKEFVGDGIIDDTEQGNAGDCWLLNNLMQLSTMEWGQDAINEVMKKDDKGNYTISFKGFDPIELTKEQLDEAMLRTADDGVSPYYATGDRDTLAIEVAIDMLEGVDLRGGNAGRFLGLFFGFDPETKAANVDGMTYGIDEIQAETVNSEMEAILGSINGTSDELDDETIVELLGDMENIMSQYETKPEGFDELKSAVVQYLNEGGSLDELNAKIEAFKTNYAQKVDEAKASGKIVSPNDDIDKAFDTLYEEYTSGNITHLNEVGIFVGDGGHSVSIKGFETGEDGQVYVLYNNPWDSSETYKDTYKDFRAMTSMVTIYAPKGSDTVAQTQPTRDEKMQFIPNDSATHGSSWDITEDDVKFSPDGKTATYYFKDKNNEYRHAEVEIDIATGKKIKETITNHESKTVKDFQSKTMSYEGPAGDKDLMKMGDYDVWEYV